MAQHDGPAFGTESERIDHALTLHPPKSPAIGARMDEIRAAAKSLGHTIDRLCPNGRYKSVALTALEETTMRAIGAIALDQDACLEAVNVDD